MPRAQCLAVVVPNRPVNDALVDALRQHECKSYANEMLIPASFN